jgi:N-acetylglucosaminyl-diphospho-decaprenol L-rhamnosyltransferase
MKLSVIIVNYNTGPLTAACIESILQQKLSFRPEIIVVDNASSDESVAHLSSDFPEVIVLANEQNLGLAAGVNAGLARARGTYCIILNPDIIVLNGALERMVSYFEQHPAVGMVGGQLISPNGEVQDSCYRFYAPMTIIYRRTWLGQTKRGRREVARFLMKDFDHASTRDVDWLMGACLMVRQAAVRELGGMDERYFLYFEDVDWCRRFWELGWHISYLPQARFSHYHQRSSEQRGIMHLLGNWIVREHIKSAVKYFWKHRGKPLPSPRF